MAVLTSGALCACTNTPREQFRQLSLLDGHHTEDKFASMDFTLDDVYPKYPEVDLMDKLPLAVRKRFALILENQKLTLRYDGGWDSWFRDSAMDLVWSCLKNSAIFGIIPMQPMRYKEDVVFFEKFVRRGDTEHGHPNYVWELDYTTVAARTRKFRLDLDPEKQGVGELAAKMRDDITREILTDLKLNSATIMTKKADFEKLTVEDIHATLCYMSGVLYRKTLRGGQKWIVINKEIAKKLQPWHLSEQFAAPERIDAIDKFTYVGTFCSAWKMFIEPSWTNNQILCGASTVEDYCPAYVYCPYILASQGKTEFDEQFNTRRPLLLRYGKKMFNSRYFGRIDYEEESPGSS